MRADAYKLEVILSDKQQWVVPVYQRHYEWEIGEDKQIPKLWEDLKDKTLEHVEGRTQFPHYFGAVLFSEPSGQPFGSIRKRFLVDGQQRITSFQLVLVVIREVATVFELEHVRDVAESYLYNEESKGMQNPEREQYKLWPSSYDRKNYCKMLDNSKDDLRNSFKDCFYKNGNIIWGRSPNLLKAYWFLYDSMYQFVIEQTDEGHEPGTILNAILSGFLSGFQVVLIHLDENDDAQEIFASLNGMAKPLTPFDLIRNDIFHRARKAGEDDEDLFNSRWNSFEKPFWNEMVRQGRFKRARSDHLITHAVIAETAREVNVGKIATEYQHYAKDRAYDSVAEELDILLAHAETYRDMEEKSDPLTSPITTVLNTWDTSIFYPLVLWVNRQRIDDTVKTEIFSILETYIVRREICGLTTKNYNKIAISMIRELAENGSDAKKLLDKLSEFEGAASRLPSNADVLDACVNRSIYSNTPSQRLRFILEKVEYSLRSKNDEAVVSTGNLTIEHVMPQKWSKHWALPSGKFAPSETVFGAISEGHVLDDQLKAEIEARRHSINTIGNLTMITGSLNPSLSNGPWKKKRAEFSKSLLVLNRDISSMDEWNEEAISERSESIGSSINKIWKTD